MGEPQASNGLRSAINRDSIERARRVQEKLGEYLSLIERVRELERDPDIALFLADKEGAGDSPQESAPRSQQRASRGRGGLLLKALRDLGIEEDFEPEEAAGIADSFGDEAVRGLTVKEANGILRHLAASGLVVQTVPGKRGKGGKMPRYKLADPPPKSKPRHAPTLSMEDI